MPFEVWRSDDHEIKNDLILIAAVLITITLFYFIGWWTLLVIAIIAIGIGVYLWIDLIRTHRHIENQVNEER